MDVFLGCKHEAFERALPDTGVKVKGIEYDMSDFLVSCVARYKDLAKVKVMRRASTPFLTEPSKPELSAAAGALDIEPDPDAALLALQTFVDTAYSHCRAAAAAKVRAAEPEIADDALEEVLDAWAADPIRRLTLYKHIASISACCHERARMQPQASPDITAS